MERFHTSYHEQPEFTGYVAAGFNKAALTLTTLALLLGGLLVSLH